MQQKSLAAERPVHVNQVVCLAPHTVNAVQVTCENEHTKHDGDIHQESESDDDNVDEDDDN